MKRTLALILSLFMIFTMSVTVFATHSGGTSYDKGKITITNPQPGETYKAYRIFDVTYDGAKYAYTTNPVWQADVISYTAATADADGVYTGKGLTLTPVKVLDSGVLTTTCYNVTVDSTFSAQDFAAAMKAAISTKAADKNFTAGVADGLDLGYYMVQPTTGTLVSLTTTDLDVKVMDKNDQPVPDKKLLNRVLTCTTEHEHTDACYGFVPEGDILYCTQDHEHSILAGCYCDKEAHTHTVEGGCYEEDGTTLKCTKPEHTHTEDCHTEKEYTTKSIGDIVPFEVDTKVPTVTGFSTYFFVLNDTMSKGLTFNNDVKVYINGVEYAAANYTVKTDDTDEDPENTNIRVVFKDALTNFAGKADQTIKITYSATLNEKAVVGTDGNTNTAQLEYSRDPNIVPEYDPTDPPTDFDDPKDPKYKHNQTTETTDDPTGLSVEDKVTVYTTELKITKIDGTTAAELTGAKFKIEGENLNVTLVNKEIFKRDDVNGTWYRLKDGTYTETEPVGKDAPLETYAKIPDTFERVTYELGDETEATIGMFFNDGVNYVEITASNKDSATAPFYDKCINIIDLYYFESETYKVVTEANYEVHLTGDLYSKTVYMRSDKYENTDQKYVKVTEITKVTDPTNFSQEGYVDSNGVIKFTGLSEGTYYLTELIAPDGYNLLKAPVKVVVELVQATGNTYKFKAVIDGDTAHPVNEDTTNHYLPFDVKNSSGIELPATGGTGTVLFITIGAILFVATGIILTAKKRLYNEGI